MFFAGSISRKAAATLDESIPPERKTPSGTSDRRCRATAPTKSPQNRSAASSNGGISACFRRRRLPVTRRFQSPVFPDEQVRRRQFFHSLPNRVRRGDIFIKEIACQAVLIKRAADPRDARAKLSAPSRTQVLRCAFPSKTTAFDPFDRAPRPVNAASRPKSPKRTCR